MAGRINYEEELRKTDEKLAELRKQKEQRAQLVSQIVSPQMPAGVDIIRRQVEQLRKMVENSNQTNVSLEPRMGMVSRLKKGFKFITAFDEYELIGMLQENADEPYAEEIARYLVKSRRRRPIEVSARIN